MNEAPWDADSPWKTAMEFEAWLRRYAKTGDPLPIFVPGNEDVNAFVPRILSLLPTAVRWCQAELDRLLAEYDVVGRGAEKHIEVQRLLYIAGYTLPVNAIPRIISFFKSARLIGAVDLAGACIGVLTAFPITPELLQVVVETARAGSHPELCFRTLARWSPPMAGELAPYLASSLEPWVFDSVWNSFTDSERNLFVRALLSSVRGLTKNR